MALENITKNKIDSFSGKGAQFRQIYGILYTQTYSLFDNKMAMELTIQTDCFTLANCVSFYCLRFGSIDS